MNEILFLHVFFTEVWINEIALQLPIHLLKNAVIASESLGSSSGSLYYWVGSWLKTSLNLGFFNMIFILFILLTIVLRIKWPVFESALLTIKPYINIRHYSYSCLQWSRNMSPFLLKKICINPVVPHVFSTNQILDNFRCYGTLNP